MIFTVACVVCSSSRSRASGRSPTPFELLDAGAASRDAVADGQWWTLLSANLLHGNPIHLLFNLVAFAVIGVLLEREVGWPRFAGVCLRWDRGDGARRGAERRRGGRMSGVIFAISAWAIMRDTHRTRMLGASRGRRSRSASSTRSSRRT